MRYEALRGYTEDRKVDSFFRCRISMLSQEEVEEIIQEMSDATKKIHEIEDDIEAMYQYIMLGDIIEDMKKMVIHYDELRNSYRELLG
jgi:transcriptional regulator with GAF, ATPase, and Fis domain